MAMVQTNASVGNVVVLAAVDGHAARMPVGNRLVPSASGCLPHHRQLLLCLHRRHHLQAHRLQTQTFQLEVVAHGLGRVKWMNVVTALHGARQMLAIAKHVMVIGLAPTDLALHLRPRLQTSLRVAVALGRKLVRQSSVGKARPGASLASAIAKSAKDIGCIQKRIWTAVSAHLMGMELTSVVVVTVAAMGVVDGHAVMIRVSLHQDPSAKLEPLKFDVGIFFVSFFTFGF